MPGAATAPAQVVSQRRHDFDLLNERQLPPSGQGASASLKRGSDANAKAGRCVRQGRQLLKGTQGGDAVLSRSTLALVTARARARGRRSGARARPAGRLVGTRSACLAEAGLEQLRPSDRPKAADLARRPGRRQHRQADRRARRGGARRGRRRHQACTLAQSRAPWMGQPGDPEGWAYDRAMSAVEAAVAVADAYGVHCEKPVVLREAWHVLVHLWPSPVVARVTSGRSRCRSGRRRT
jgi:hypothetical protein